MNTPYNALLIAKYFVKKAKDSKSKITNLKVQKLLYYAQGWYLANFKGQRLFEDPIEAWKYGPAVRSVYREFSKYGAGDIDINVTDEEINKIDPDTKKFLDALWNVYGKLSAGDLVLATHQEIPWINTRKEIDEDDGEISINEIQESFEKKLKS
jgi:uncharacterized phage-associated protein